MSVPVTSGLLDALKRVLRSGGSAGDLFLSKFVSPFVDVFPIVADFSIQRASENLVGAGMLELVVPEGELWLVLHVSCSTAAATLTELSLAHASSGNVVQLLLQAAASSLIWQPTCPFWVRGKSSFSLISNAAGIIDINVYCLRVLV